VGLRERIEVERQRRLVVLEETRDRMFKAAERAESRWLIDPDARRTADTIWDALVEIETKIIQLGGAL
jgi:heptaprenylglyceryl phosphate synthase